SRRAPSRRVSPGPAPRRQARRRSRFRAPARTPTTRSAPRSNAPTRRDPRASSFGSSSSSHHPKNADSPADERTPVVPAAERRHAVLLHRERVVVAVPVFAVDEAVPVVVDSVGAPGAHHRLLLFEPQRLVPVFGRTAVHLHVRRA